MVSNEETSESSIRYPETPIGGESKDGRKLISNQIISPIIPPIIPPISSRTPKLKSYQLFLKNTKETPITGRKAFIMEAAAIWRSLPREEKEMFHELAGADRAVAESEGKKLALRERSLWKVMNEEEREMYQGLSEEEKEKYSKEGRSIKEPLRSFSFFLKEEKVSGAVWCSMTQGEKMKAEKVSAAVWCRMRQGEKMKYHTLARRDQLRFMGECLERLRDKPTCRHIHERVRRLSKGGPGLY